MNGLALCAGIGGLERGIGLAIDGYRCVGYVEREAYAAAALVARMGEQALDPAPVWDDLESFDGRAWRGVVDLISAGFPCQPFSAAGKQRGVEDERWLWPIIERIVGEVQPRWLVLENVPGVVRHGLGPVLSGLARLGYDAEWDLFTAQSVGAPHRRERFFMVARRVPDAERDAVRDEPKRGPGPAPASDSGHTEPRDVEQAVADAERDGHERRRPTGAPTDWRRRSTDKCSEVADADGAGLKGQRSGTGAWNGEPEHGNDVDGRYRAAAFPPGPTDFDMWTRVLAVAPEVEPAVCRLADGSAAALEYRADRLRAYGNGVVPLQAAHAIRTLAAQAGWDLCSLT